MMRVRGVVTARDSSGPSHADRPHTTCLVVCPGRCTDCLPTVYSFNCFGSTHRSAQGESCPDSNLSAKGWEITVAATNRTFHRVAESGALPARRHGHR
jgi:hypothetical protein